MKAKTDVRKLDQSTQAHLRKMVVQAVRDGMTQVYAARTYRVSLRAISGWMFVTDAQLKQGADYQVVNELLADRLSRQLYESELEAVLTECQACATPDKGRD
ncbi:hypothetical protein FPJ27_15310 [Burkholderia sp. MS455]|uniref:hypothetical protein n=1 Tax=Burkholderia sp. MS455 TaxID=2811788 RepID=UPI0019586ED2|nr:hypothetical protein [Burkholderia sp. MS455]QRR07633.1 hypothetical protein FPJ27_15310 [Burkholderia sp. MS455]